MFHFMSCHPFTCIQCVLSHFSHVQLCNPMDHGLPGSAVYGILQARILKSLGWLSSLGYGINLILIQPLAEATVCTGKKLDSTLAFAFWDMLCFLPWAPYWHWSINQRGCSASKRELWTCRTFTVLNVMGRQGFGG